MNRTPPQTTQHPLPDDTSYQSALHRGHHDQRRLIIRAARSGDPRRDPNADEADEILPLRIATKIECCGRSAAIWWSDDAARCIPTHALCKSRCCPTCATLRARRNIAIITPALEKMYEPKMLTLTLKAKDQPLRESIKRLQGAFQKFRRKKRWTQHVTGGVAIIEITRNPTSRQWHPHLHLLIDAKRWDWREIRGFWKDITGDSTAIDIRVIHDRRRVAGYVASYTQKATTAPTTDQAALREWITAIHRLRMFQTFGTLHGSERTEQATDRPRLTEQLCSMHTLVDDARTGNTEAERILAQLRYLKRHPTPDPDSPHALELATRHRNLAQQIRTWRSNQTHHDVHPAADPPHPPEHLPDPDFWSIGIGKINDPQPPPGALEIARADAPPTPRSRNAHHRNVA